MPDPARRKCYIPWRTPGPSSSQVQKEWAISLRLNSNGPANRAGEEFDHVEDFLAGVVDFGAGTQLQQAPWICGDDGLRAGGARMVHFFREQCHRGFRLRHVVNSR